jgi:hypothetical protein
MLIFFVFLFGQLSFKNLDVDNNILKGAENESISLGSNDLDEDYLNDSLILEKRDDRDFYIEIYDTEILRDISNNKLRIRGYLVNNLNFGVNKLWLQLRFYNEMQLENELVYIKNKRSSLLNSQQTNHYANVDKGLFNGESSLNNFEKGVSSFELIFEDIPSYDSSDEYLDNMWCWHKNRYDVDKADLILYHDGKVMQKVPVDLKSLYEKDVRIDVLGLSWYKEGQRAYFNSLNLQINNSELFNLSNLEIVINHVNFKNSDEIRLNFYEQLDNESLNFRFFPENMKYVYYDEKGGSDNLTIELRENGELLDYVFVSGKMGIGEVKIMKESGYKIKFENFYEMSNEIEIIVEEGDVPIENPVIEVLCGNHINYDLEGYDEIFVIKFDDYARCISPVVRLRDGAFAEIYAEEEISDKLWVNLDYNVYNVEMDITNFYIF